MSFEVNGQRLRELRVQSALSLRALRERSGVAYDTINKLELGQRPARLSTIRKLADALGVHVVTTFRVDGSTFSSPSSRRRCAGKAQSPLLAE